MTESNPSDRRRFFKQLFVPDVKAPNRAPWHRVPEVGAGDGDVLWSGWTGDGELFVVGDEGKILHYDATVSENAPRWQQMSVPVRQPLHSIWGSSPKNIFAVGWMGCLLHYDGEQWQKLRGGLIDERTERFAACKENTPLFAIDGNQKGQAWAVGDDGVILHFDGLIWQSQESPTKMNLRTVVCATDNTVYAAGGEGTVLKCEENGEWTQLECPYGSGFQTMLEMPDGSLLLAGGRYFVDQGGFRGELVRYKNGIFQALEFSEAMPRLRSLKHYKGGVLITGDKGHLYYLADLRLDKLESNTHHDLMDSVVMPTGEAIVVGDFGTIMTAAQDFTKVLAPPPKTQAQSVWEKMAAPTDRQLWGVSEGLDGSLYTYGEEGTVLRLQNDEWQVLPAPSELTVHSLVDTGNGLFAAGQFGRIYRFGGEHWTLHFDLHLDITILALWASSPDSIYAVGDEGLVLHYNGLSWERLSSGTKSALYSIWAWDEKHMLAPGDFGLILRYNGSEWTDFNVGTENFIYDVWGDSLSNIYAVGLSGTLSHFNGQRWQKMATRMQDDLLAIDGSTLHGAYIVGTRGRILRLEDGQLKPEESGTDAGLRAVCVTKNNGVFAVGDKGIVLRRLG